MVNQDQLYSVIQFALNRTELHKGSVDHFYQYMSGSRNIIQSGASILHLNAISSARNNLVWLQIPKDI